MKDAYAQQLRDPRWQKKRLEIFQRDNWQCQSEGCGKTEMTLHVHHLYYLPDTPPWDYPDASLKTLCEKCHAEETQRRPDVERYLLHALRTSGLDSFGLAILGNIFAVACGPNYGAQGQAFAKHLLRKLFAVCEQEAQIAREEWREMTNCWRFQKR